jgi:hypothetical protein
MSPQFIFRWQTSAEDKMQCPRAIKAVKSASVMNFRSLPIVAACWIVGATPVLAEVTVTEDAATIDGVAFTRKDPITVVGKVDWHPGDALRYSRGEAILNALKINGRANQDSLEFHLLPGTWQKNSASSKDHAWFEATGQWRDARLRGNHKVMTFQVRSLKEIEPVTLRFEDFRDRQAKFTGTVMKDGLFSLGEETAKLEGMSEWPAQVIGKDVTVRGIVKQTGPDWQFSAASWQLEKLADQIGQEVALDGVLWSQNGGWWFEYRGEPVWLLDERGSKLTFQTDRHATIARVKGRLQQLRPALNDVTTKGEADPVPQYVVRCPQVEFLEPALSIGERFRAVYAKPVLMKDGVPVLVAEESWRMNGMDHETKAMRYMERNRPAIESTLKAPVPARVEVMAKRMVAEKNQPLKLLYAAMLAACNDARGRTTLLDAVKNHKNTSHNALYCLGIFPFLPPKDTTLKPDTAWAEDTLVGLLSDPATAEDCAVFSSIIEVLLSCGSKQATAAVVNFALSGAEGSDAAVDELCESDAPLDLATLIKLAGAPTADEPNSRVLRKMLTQREPAAVKIFGGLLGKSQVSYEFSEGLTPAIVEALRAELGTLKGEAATTARVLVASQAPDAVGELLKLLEDPQWPNQRTVLWMLVDFKDPRMLEPLARCLRRAKDGYFKSELEITRSIDAIAGIGGDAAIAELIRLLSVDFGRAQADYMDDATLHREVAAHLIELTGESFGVDGAAWDKWFAAWKSGQ